MTVGVNTEVIFYKKSRTNGSKEILKNNSIDSLFCETINCINNQRKPSIFYKNIFLL